MENKRVLRIEYDNAYPLWSMLIAMALILASPFVSVYLNYAAMAICMYRVLRFDAKTFATDYVLLAPVAGIFKMPGGLTLLILLCLFAAAAYFLREGIKADKAFFVVLALLNYLLLRMEMNFTAYLLCFGQMFLLWILLPKQDGASAIRTAKAYCTGLLIVSIYALLLSNTSQIQALIGSGSEAIWGLGIMRFHGLVGDPNFYMTELLVGVALLAKLKETGNINLLTFILEGLAMVTLGILTYSKTFLVALVIFVAVYIVWQFRNKRLVLGIVLVAAVAISAEFLLLSEDSPFAVVVQRFMGGEDINDLTTGRSEIFRQYSEAIIKTPGSLLFGYGLGPNTLEKDPHNIYLEVLYHTGIVGFVLISGFVGSMVSVLKHQESFASQQSFIAKYVVLGMVLVLFMTLNGLFMVEVYPSFFLGLLAILIPPKDLIQA